jgi:hypothetical protein
MAPPLHGSKEMDRSAAGCCHRLCYAAVSEALEQHAVILVDMKPHNSRQPIDGATAGGATISNQEGGTHVAESFSLTRVSSVRPNTLTGRIPPMLPCPLGRHRLAARVDCKPWNHLETASVP